jgi:hypothetical protein
VLPARSAPKARSPVPMASPRREGAAAPLALMSPLVLPLYRLGPEPPALIAAGWALVDPQLLYLLQPVAGGRSFLIVGRAGGLVSLFFTGGCPALTWVPFVIARHGCRPPRSGGHGCPDTPAVVGYGGSWQALRPVSGAAAAVQEARRPGGIVDAVRVARQRPPLRRPPPGAGRQRGGGYGPGRRPGLRRCPASSTRRPPCPSRRPRRAARPSTSSTEPSPAVGQRIWGPLHITTGVDRDSARTWDPAGHQGVYRKISGRAQRRRRACCLTSADRSRRVRTPAVPPSAVAGRTR